MAPDSDVSTLVAAIRAGDRRALARALTAIEGASASGLAVLDALDRNRPDAGTREPYRLGITGPPGAGKSTLIDRLIAARRAAGDRVAVLAIDPTSPVTGGALLGDRVRWSRHATDEGVFVRSMASRGALGGLAPMALESLELLAAADFDVVVLETVGVGQAEVDVAAACDSVLVVLHPESGDGIQALKAGLVEIADVLAVNKADRPGADRLVMELEGALALRAPCAGNASPGEHGDSNSDAHDDARGGFGDGDPEVALDALEPWSVPVLQTVATDGTGLDELWEALQRHRRHARDSGVRVARHHERARCRARGRIESALLERFWESRADRLDHAVDAALAGTRTLSDAIAPLLAVAAHGPGGLAGNASADDASAPTDPDAPTDADDHLRFFLAHELRQLLNRYTREALIGTKLLDKNEWATATNATEHRHPYFDISSRLIAETIERLEGHLDSTEGHLDSTEGS